MTVAWVVGLLAAGVAAAAAQPEAPAPGTLVFRESFEDTLWAARGWYDGPHMQIETRADAPDGDAVMVWDWERAGAIGPAGGGARLPIPPLTDVTLSFWLRCDEDWTWTGVGYHPHMFHFLTSEDDRYVGPAWTHLTTYTEVVNGVPRLALQDGRNIDPERVPEDLATLTEARAIAGCNGDSDGYGEGDCYRAGDNWVNGKVWEADSVWFGPDPGPRYQAAWHSVRSRFRLNSVADGRARHDGVLQMWVDDTLVIDARTVVLRTAAHPEMTFDQFLMGPYYGPGVPHRQRLWIDDLRILASPEAQPSAVRPSSWGQVKGTP